MACEGIIVCISEQTQLGKVRRDYICTSGKLLHGCQQFIREDGKAPAVGAHHWVCHIEVVFCLELIQKIQHILHLCITAQKAGVYAIKGLVHLNPFLGDLIHFVCIIIIKIAVKTCLG